MWVVLMSAFTKLGTVSRNIQLTIQQAIKQSNQSKIWFQTSQAKKSRSRVELHSGCVYTRHSYGSRSDQIISQSGHGAFTLVYHMASVSGYLIGISLSCAISVCRGKMAPQSRPFFVRFLLKTTFSRGRLYKSHKLRRMRRFLILLWRIAGIMETVKRNLWVQDCCQLWWGKCVYFTENEWFCNFLVRKQTFHYICELLLHQLSPETTQLCAAIRERGGEIMVVGGVLCEVDL